jgi:hypothetical protein
VGKVDKFLNATYTNATYNQMFNDGRFITAQLDKERRQSSAAVNRANSQVHVVRERAASAEYAAGVYRVASRVALWSALMASLAMAVFAADAVRGNAAIALACCIGVLYLIGLMGMVRTSAGRRRTDWHRFYWGEARATTSSD